MLRQAWAVPVILVHIWLESRWRFRTYARSLTHWIAVYACLLKTCVPSSWWLAQNVLLKMSSSMKTWIPGFMFALNMEGFWQVSTGTGWFDNSEHRFSCELFHSFFGRFILIANYFMFAEMVTTGHGWGFFRHRWYGVADTWAFVRWYESKPTGINAQSWWFSTNR